MATEDTYPSDDLDPSTDEGIVKEAQKRFNRCSSWEAASRVLIIQDTKFANADSDNMYQWDDNVRDGRGYGTIDAKPCLTINKTRQHCLQIINDAKQNKPSIKVKPVGNGATYEAAEVFEGVVRHIEYISNAQSAYDTATTHQVWGGIGWFRVVTDYPDDDTFDQEIFIRRIKDPLTVYLDPDIREADGSDARFGFVFDDMSKDDFDAAYPKYKHLASQAPLSATGTGGNNWTGENKVRVAEYYRTVKENDTLVAYPDPATGQIIQERKSKVAKELFKTIADDPHTKLREIVDTKIEWFLIVGNEIAERTTWPGRYIPLVRVIGEETVIEGIMDRKGHVRAMKDPQRVYNYWTSSAVEMVALQSKTPFIGPMDAFSNLETYYEEANTTNPAWLPYNAYDDQGRAIPAPKRQEPPVMAAAYMQGMNISSEELRAVSGQYQSEMGAPSNEKSGVAIQQRQRQGDNATYHFIDNLALAIRFAGKILIDLIPKIYDTRRIIKIMAEDGIENEILVDPQAQQAFVKKQKSENNVIESIFNPSVGKYDVEADVGPAYATRRQEAFSAFVEIMRSDPKLMQVAGDLMFKAADFPMAKELAERIKRTIPPAIRGDAPPPEVEQVLNQNKQLQALVQQAVLALSEEKKKNKVAEQKVELEGVGKEIDGFKAQTDRMKVTGSQDMATNEFLLSVAQMVEGIMSERASGAQQVIAPAIGNDVQQTEAA